MLEALVAGRALLTFCFVRMGVGVQTVPPDPVEAVDGVKQLSQYSYLSQLYVRPVQRNVCENL
jgi:hypothetical protein